jgi:hypothetical protein
MGPSQKKQNNGHHKSCIKTHEAEWPLEFIGGKYMYYSAGEGQQQL